MKVKYFTKSIQYYSYFQDVKLIDLDEDNKKISLVLNGKEEYVYIFDLEPYMNYDPLENSTRILSKEYKSHNWSEEIGKKNKIGVVQIEEHPNSIDINQVFQKIVKINYQSISVNNNNIHINNFNNININISNNKPVDKINISPIIYHNFNSSNNNKTRTNQIIQEKDGQSLFIYNNFFGNIGHDNKGMSLPFLLSNNLSNSNENMIIKEKVIYSITKFEIFFLSPFRFLQNVKLSMKKPIVKTNLLSSIELKNEKIIGIKWIYLKKTLEKIPFKYDKYNEKDRYISYSQFLLILTEAGLIAIYELVKYKPFNETIVDEKLKDKHSVNINYCIEKYKELFQKKTKYKIIDYYIFNISDKNTNSLSSSFRLITLNENNIFSFWEIKSTARENNNSIFDYDLNFLYNYKIKDNIFDYFLIDHNEKYLICFNNLFFQIFFLFDNHKIHKCIYKFSFNGEEEEGKEEKKEEEKEGNNNLNNNQNNKNKIIKPCFICEQNKIIFEYYLIKEQTYQLCIFDFFLFYSHKEYKDNDNLIYKIYSSKDKIFFSPSPNLYLNFSKKELFVDFISLLDSKEIEKLKKKQINVISFIKNIFQGVFIKEGNNNMIIKFNIFEPSDLAMINKDINLTKKFLRKENKEENVEEINHNFAVKWTIRNTILENSDNNLFHLIKFTDEYNALGIPIRKDLFRKLIERTNYK